MQGQPDQLKNKDCSISQTSYVHVTKIYILNSNYIYYPNVSCVPGTKQFGFESANLQPGLHSIFIIIYWHLPSTNVIYNQVIFFFSPLGPLT